MFGIQHRALARKLIRLLSVLAPALPIPLPGDRPVAAAWCADLSTRKDKVDVGEHVVNAVRVMLDATRMHDHSSSGAPVQSSGLDNLFGGHSSNLGGNLRRVTQDELSRFIPAIGAPGYERLVGQTLLNHDVEHSVCEGDICAGPELQVQVTLSCRCRLARVNNDPTPAVVALLPEELVQHRKRLRAVRAGDQQHLCKRNVAPGVCGAVNAEGFVVACRGTHHAEPSVVINIASAQTGARELAHQICLFSRERRARINPNRVLAVRRLEPLEFRNNQIKCLIPCRAFE